MANCYVCGVYLPPHEPHYRREVPTGRSVGGWVSRRSYGAGSRAYYGLRTLCATCAAAKDAHDRAVGRAVGIIVLIVVVIVALGYLAR